MWARYVFISCFTLVLFVSVASGLYEDQIGKFDWRQQFIGKANHALIDVSGKKIVVGTDENVLASLQAGTGKLEWRQIFSPGPKGKIHSVFTMDAGKIIAISGMPVSVKAFDINNGILLWETSLLKESQNVVFSHWSSNLKDVVSVEVIDTESSYKLIATEYQSYSGVETVVQTMTLPWFNTNMKCEFAYPQLLCLNSNRDGLDVIDIRDDESHTKIHLTDLGMAGPAEMGVTKHHTAVLPFVWIRDAEQLLVLKACGSDQTLKPITSLPMSTQLIDVPVQKETTSGEYLAYLSAENSIEILDTATGEIMKDVGGRVTLPSQVGAPQLFSIYLLKKQQGDLSYRFLISTEDHALLYGSRKEIYWRREESLTSIIQVEMVDLPVTEAEVSIEEEFATDPNGILAHTLRRLGSQMRQLSVFWRTILRGSDQPDRTNSNALVRDRFGLHKLILILTKPGKLFAMDTITGRIVWQRLLTTTGDKMVLFVQRTSIHYPLEPQCTVLIQQQPGADSRGASLFVFHPITGEPANQGDGYIHLDYVVQQAILLPQSEETDFVKTLLLIDDQTLPHVFPSTELTLNQVVKMADQLFFFTADTKSCLMRGYSLRRSTKDQLTASAVWKLQLCSGDASYAETIGSIVGRHPEEKVHSQGRVLSDRSVLYKYLNPNLVVVTTEGTHPHYRGYLNIYLVDVVSGTVVFSASHRRVLGPVHVVHAENWIVYSYYNEKFRRTELASLELFEGKEQSNSTAFSSFTAPLPFVDRQAYIYPAHITAMKDTFSEQGMTAKHLLLSLSNGWIQELPRVFVDPRRPQVAAATAEMREEGIIPYLPELPIPPEAILNYNQTVANVKGIYVAPSSLESTGLVFAYGLDVFFTHVTPSRTFDVLNDDFEFVFIALVLSGLTLASLITKRLASKKVLRQAWK